MNKVILSGRITKDLELRTTAENKIVRFTLAVDRRKRDEADFISCVAWNKTAELLYQYCGRGSKIGLVGRIQTGSYTSQSGEKKYSTDVVADEIEFLDPKSKDEKKEERKPDENGFIPVSPDDDLPWM